MKTKVFRGISTEFAMCFATAIFADTISQRPQRSTAWVKVEVSQNLGGTLACGFYAAVLFFCQQEVRNKSAGNKHPEANETWIYPDLYSYC